MCSPNELVTQQMLKQGFLPGQGLDLFQEEGICLALQERCCFYVNKSGIVRDKIKKLQEDLIEEKAAFSMWAGKPYSSPAVQ
ncbi:hypothetical protein QTO34_002606, partial [Cnephaeus nilssonii]